MNPKLALLDKLTTDNLKVALDGLPKKMALKILRKFEIFSGQEEWFKEMQRFLGETKENKKNKSVHERY